MTDARTANEPTVRERGSALVLGPYMVAKDQAAMDSYVLHLAAAALEDGADELDLGDILLGYAQCNLQYADTVLVLKGIAP